MHSTKEEYIKRIILASPLGLVQLNYEIILFYLSIAKKNILEENILEKNILEKNILEENNYNKNINKAHGFLKELILSLDMDIDISKDLYSIYIYINGLFVNKIKNGDIEAINEAEKIIVILLQAYKAISDNDENIKNTPKLFAGLTYDKNGLAEYSNTDSSRDYMV